MEITNAMLNEIIAKLEAEKEYYSDYSAKSKEIKATIYTLNTLKTDDAEEATEGLFSNNDPMDIAEREYQQDINNGDGIDYGGFDKPSQY